MRVTGWKLLRLIKYVFVLSKILIIHIYCFISFKTIYKSTFELGLDIEKVNFFQKRKNAVFCC